MNTILRPGQKVRFSVKSGNRNEFPFRLIESHEMHEGLIFYRIVGIKGGLFLRSSLVTTRRAGGAQ